MPDPEKTTLTSEQQQSIARFARALKQGAQPNPEEFLTGTDADARTASLCAMVALDLEARWKAWLLQREQRDETQGEQDRISEGDSAPLLESYLKEYPILKQTHHLQWLVDREMEIRTECGDSVPDNEYQARFPELQFNDTSLTGLRTVAQKAPPRGGGWLSQPQELELDRPFGPYELVEKIGAGGMGLVYKARQVSADRIVALKILRLDRAHDSVASSGFLDRFQTEARATSRIDHPGIVTVYDVGEIDGLPYYAMKFVEGENLSQRHSREPFDQREAARIIAEAARALQAAHNCGVLHRDLKPQNIMIDRNSGQPCLADFGLAKLVEADQSQTREGDILGTPGYMPPEQARDSGSVTTLADVYGLGASLYFLLTGQPPFTGSSALQILRRVVDEPVQPPSSVDRSIDSDLELICLKSIEKDPEKRYPTAAALADDLERWLNGEPITARPVGRLEKFYRLCKRNPFTASLIAVTACSLILVAVTSYLGKREVSRLLAESEESYRQATATVNDYFTIVSEDILLQQPAMQPLRRKLLEKALQHYRRFLDRKGSDNSLQQEIAETHYRIGRIEELIESCDAAQESYARAERLQRKLLSQSPGSGELQMSLSHTLTARARCFNQQHDVPAALANMEQSHALRQSLVESNPDDLEAIRLLANAEMNLAILHLAQRQVDLARQEYETSLERRRPFLARQDPIGEEMLRDQGMCLYNLANLEFEYRQPESSHSVVTDAIQIFERCLQSTTQPFEIRERLGLSYRLRGHLLFEEFKFDEALDAYESAARVLGDLANENPQVYPLRQALGEVEFLRGAALQEQEKLEETLTAMNRSIDQFSRLPEELLDPEHFLIRALHVRAVVHLQFGESLEARQDLERCLSLIAQAQTTWPDDASLAEQLDGAQSLLKQLPPAGSIRNEF